MTKRQRFEFKNQRGEALAALLEEPYQVTKAYAVMAHCFTCGKDLNVATRISHELTKAGWGVLRFDFTGLGNSDGDFENTNFSSNVEDLIAACQTMCDLGKPTRLIIGHSLGGAAALVAAHKVSDIEMVATIGAPSDTQHVSHLFKEKISEIKEDGVANVSIAGRDFKIKKQFLEDIEEQKVSENLHKLKKPLLILHSPQDQIVGIDNAKNIFVSAMHPKSFVSLDGADHLLSKRQDAEYTGDVIAAWSSRYLLNPIPKAEQRKLDHGAAYITELDHKFLQRVDVGGGHSLIADEPKDVGGSELGPNPYDFLSSALATCTAMTLRMYAKHKKLPLDHVEVEVSHSRIHAKDCGDCESRSGKVDVLTKKIYVSGDLSDENLEKLYEISAKCPVHRTLLNEIKINSEVQKA
jgi:putative redox protein